MVNVTKAQKREAQQAEVVDRQLRRMFLELLETKQWQAYSEFLGKKIQEQADLLLQPEQALTLGRGTNSEFVKGTMNGLILARTLPAASIQIADAAFGPSSSDPNVDEKLTEFNDDEDDEDVAPQPAPVP